MTCFADAFFYIALINREDEYHRQVLAHARTFTGRIVTTRWVLMEVADALAASRARVHVRVAIEQIESDPGTEIVEASTELFQRGLKLYDARPDKGWSLTDCLSFVVMTDLKLRDALTGDHHFSQAGFAPAFV